METVILFALASIEFSINSLISLIIGLKSIALSKGVVPQPPELKIKTTSLS